MQTGIPRREMGTTIIIIYLKPLQKWITRAVLTSNVRIKASKQMLYKTTRRV